MEDKMIELMSFTKVSEAEMLANLLKSEGVNCYVRDAFMSQIYHGADLGGAKVELLEKDLERAMEIMKDYNYLPKEEIDADVVADFEQDKRKLSRFLMFITALIILMVVVIILLNKYFNGK